MQEGVGRLFDQRERNDRADLDFLPGTSLSLGYDLLYFRPFDPRVNLQTAISAAVTGCSKEREAAIQKDPTASALPNHYSARDISKWAFEPKFNEGTEIFDFKRPKFANALIDAGWGKEEKPSLKFGLGGSIGYSDPMFTYSPGAVLTTVSDSAKITLAPDPNVALGTEVERGQRSGI